jgi:hypothetical protein
MSSRSIPFHLLRGLCGFGLLAIALLYGGDIGWWAVIPGLGALICLGGCPMCWVIGLVATVMDRKCGVCR